MVAELNNGSGASSTQPPLIKQRLLVKDAFARDDPREFLG